LDAVIKIGGSLSVTSGALKELGAAMCSLAKNYQVVFVPGGGQFADTVRKLDAKYNLPPAKSHKMAILAMDQCGLLFSHVIPNAICCYSLEAAKKFSKNHLAVILLPSKLLFKEDPFEPSWEVTSDSISAYIAVKLNATKAVFVTDVDGIFTQDPKACADAALLKNISAPYLLGFDKRTSVDKCLPKFLIENSLDCYVVNGYHPERIETILSGKETICTRILPSR
jgi:hypothetical protein